MLLSIFHNGWEEGLEVLLGFSATPHQINSMVNETGRVLLKGSGSHPATSCDLMHPNAAPTCLGVKGRGGMKLCGHSQHSPRQWDRQCPRLSVRMRRHRHLINVSLPCQAVLSQGVGLDGMDSQRLRR